MIVFKSIVNVPNDFTGICQITKSGTILYYKDGNYHNENGQAVIYSNGSKSWYINGLEHREDGPSTEYADGSKRWYYKGKLYGLGNDFTIKTWKEKVKELKREEELRIFL